MEGEIIVVERLEEDKSIGIVHTQDGKVHYVVKSEKWETFKPLLAAGSSVVVTLVDVKGNSAIAKIGDQETSSKGARGKLPKFVMQWKSAQEREKKKQAEGEKGKELLEAFKDVFGFRPLVEAKITDPSQRRKYTELDTLGEEHVGQEVWIRGRIHVDRPVSAKLLFLTLRYRQGTVQVVLSEPTELVKFAKGLSHESVIDVYGKVTKAAEPITSVSQQNVEVEVRKLFVISQAIPKLPLELEAASRPDHVIEGRKKEIDELDARIKEVEVQLASAEDKKELQAELESLQQKKKELKPYSTVLVDTRLNNRVLELRTSANQAIFKVQAGVGRLFREILTREGFTEIHSPKLISAASEGGAAVFKCGYFEQYGIPNAYLAQSPQLYKQMAIAADFNRVFEIGPVFRREDSNTHRHLVEFTGLDLEMSFKQHYHEVLDVLDQLFVNLFHALETEFAKELHTINQQYPFEPLQYLKPSLRLAWNEAIPLLQQELAKPTEETVDPALVAELKKELEDDGKTNVGDFDDLSTRAEKLLGRVVKAKYHTDFYILDRFPLTIRPFYTMPDPTDEHYSNSYDLFLRGEEICSGAQRIHEPTMLRERALAHGVDISTIQAYIEAFNFAAEPHGGGGIGLERVVMLYLGLNNIRKTSLFPRDPKRITP